MGRRSEAWMTAALRAGALYAASVFAAGFVLGVVRTLAVRATGVDPLLAVLAEIPVMLAVSWIVCGAVIRRTGLSSSIAARSTMGASAFGLLIAGEVALGAILSGGFGSAVASFAEPAALGGLAAQVLYGLFPLLRAGIPYTK